MDALTTETWVLYWCDERPESWVATDGTEALYLFDADTDGWQQRRPYDGPREGLREAAGVNALGTGWPGVEMARRAAQAEHAD